MCCCDILVDILQDKGFMANSIKGIIYAAHAAFSKIWWKIMGRGRIDYFSVPIIINNFNRLTDLKLLIDSLKSRGYHNIIILDNASSYPPLLEYYQHCECKVKLLGHNYGFQALWESGVYKEFKKNWYIYTDPDVVLDESCPSNFVERLFSILMKYPLASKAGLGIRIDDIPDCYSQKDSVLKFEAEYWENEIERGVYKALVDTTLALYPPRQKWGTNINKLMLRTGFPYVIKHLPWYVDSNDITEEEKYYINHCAKKASLWINNESC